MLTAAHRLEVVREIWAKAYADGGYADGYRALYAYERAVKEQP